MLDAPLIDIAFGDSSLRSSGDTAAETLRSEATPNVGPFAPPIIAHTAIISISWSGYFFLLSILKSATDMSASLSVSGLFSASSACLASVAGSMSFFFSFPA